MTSIDELVRTGHFAFESGHHGDTWLELDLLVSEPTRVREAAAQLAEGLKRYEADLVCGPLDGGAFVAQWVAAALGARFTYTRREPGPRYTTPPGVALDGLRAIVVDDAINAGSATTATVRELTGRGCEVVAIASVLLCLPSGAEVGPRLGFPQVHLTEVATALWLPRECPMCREGVPLDLPTCPSARTGGAAAPGAPRAGCGSAPPPAGRAGRAGS